MPSRLEHFYFHDVNLALVRVDMSTQFDVVAYVFLQSLRINYIPSLLVVIGDKRDFVAFRFYGALDIRQFRLLFFLFRLLRSSVVGENRHPQCRYRENDWQNG